MRRLTEVALLLIQWGLMTLGLLMVLLGLLMYWQNVILQSSLPSIGQGTAAIYADTYYIAAAPLTGLLFTTVGGLIPMGLGAALLYLRHLYLARS